ncbi:hypothetical protein BDQ17DRAFT_1434696 [Cyathus striatus]|nr:hypothetical protein BDQ17DRAFT_1434696 [Cyathus striatus]
MSNHPLSFSLAREHHIPNNSERTTIQFLISSCEAFLHMAESKRFALEFHISNIQSYRDLLYSLISPIEKLPDDILREIFSNLCEDIIDIGGRYGQFWDIRNVSTNWRNIIDSTPYFWSGLKMRRRRYVQVKDALIFQRILLCAKFSGEVPLTIALLEKHMSPKEHEAIIHIASQANRWVSLEITTCILNDYKIQDVIRNQGLTRLRKLNLQGPLSVLTNYDMFHSATSIEELVLDYIYFPGAFGIPMDNSVKRLTMTNCGWTNRLDKLDVLYSKLRSMSSLEELTWISNTFGEEAPTEVIMLPSLHTLSCGHSSMYSEPDPKMWDMLRVPSLKHLEINYRWPSAIGPILSMVTSSNSFVTQLQLS